MALNLNGLCLLVACVAISGMTFTDEPLGQRDLSPVKVLSTPRHPAISLVTDERAEAVVYVAPAVAEGERKGDIVL